MPLVLSGTDGVSGVDGTASNPAIEGTDSNTGIFYPAADTVAIGTGGTEALRVNSSQQVGINTSSPTAPLDVVSNSAATSIKARGRSSDNIGVQLFTANNGSTNYGSILWKSDEVRFVNENAGYLSFYTSATERARINSGGILLVGTTSDANLPGSGTNNATGVAVGGSQVRACRNEYTFQIGVTDTGAGKFLQQFFQAGTNCGQITVSNSNATAYQTSSDYRLKDNPQPMIGALEKVAALKPCTWTWKNSGTAGQGFIAHEVQQYFPDAVSGEKDGVDENGNPQYQGIDTSFLVATLTAAIQEQQAMIDELKAKVAALESA